MDMVHQPSYHQGCVVGQGGEWVMVVAGLRVRQTARRFNQSIVKEISPGYSLEGLMLKLKLQYFGHLI